MKVKELKQILNDIPDDALVMISTQYADKEELVKHYYVSRDEIISTIDENNMDFLIFEYDNWESIYDDLSVKEYPRNGKIIGILLSSH